MRVPVANASERPPANTANGDWYESSRKPAITKRLPSAYVLGIVVK